MYTLEPKPFLIGISIHFMISNIFERLRNYFPFFLPLQLQTETMRILEGTLTIVLATRRRWRADLHCFAARHSLGAHRAALQMYQYVHFVKNLLLYPYTGPSEEIGPSTLVPLYETNYW